MPNNVCFCSATSVGVPRLKRLLLAVAWLYTDVGYCQGLGVIAANLLLFMEEEAAFWMMCSIIEDILPPSYFSADSLIGVQADQRVLGELISVFMPRLKGVIQEHEVDLALITLGWFLTLFSGVLSIRVMLRVWDLLFYEGSTVLFRIALAILKLNEEVLIETKNTASFFNAVSAAPSLITDVAELCKVAYSFEDEYLDQTYIEGLRRHHLSQLLVEISSSQCLAPAKPLPKQFLSKRNIKGKPSLFCGFFGDTHASEPQNELFSVLDSSTSFSFSSGLQEVIGSTLCLSGADRLIGDRHINDYLHFNDPDSTDPKIKNIRQTELLVNLRQAIIAIVRHFHSNDPSHSKISDQPDYSLASHGKDLAVYVQTAAVQTRRAKALEDFARQETDELGFLRNDIITVLDMHDEHCWLGELNSLRGWFPAKLVELLDERSKCYTPAGDDTVYPDIGHLVRHGLCSALRAIFEYGLKRTRGLTDTSSSHPWKFIEEVAAVEAARDSSSIHSRLILCRTFRLDEVGKVLSPEELLYRSIHSINASHTSPGVTDDVKFHALICIGLNELVLHLWLEILCSCEEVVTKRYHPWSFLRSPGWVQIKCELRVLSQFAFHLYPLWEITAHLESSKALATYEHKSFHKAKLPLRLLSKLRLGVRPLDPSDSWDFGAFKRDTESTGDMLVKYHLFSWEL
uniref:RUN and TBC1 domain-containing protein 3 n=1 Tax=Schistocephalus solidus TaxID=70667 RepID=A0A0X3NUK9_SCHSO